MNLPVTRGLVHQQSTATDQDRLDFIISFRDVTGMDNVKRNILEQQSKNGGITSTGLDAPLAVYFLNSFSV